MKALTPWLLVAVLGGLIYWTNCRDAKIHDDGVKLDTVLVEQKKTLGKVRKATDARVEQADSTLPDTTVRRLITGERLACDAVLLTCAERVVNLKKQLRGATLSVFGAAAYRFPNNQPLLKGPLSVQGGATLRIQRGMYLDGWRDWPLTGDSLAKSSWNIRIRQEVKIF